MKMHPDDFYTVICKSPETLTAHPTRQEGFNFLHDRGLISDEEYGNQELDWDNDRVMYFNSAPPWDWFDENWLGSEFFAVGDYGGGGAPAQANIEWAEENLTFGVDYYSESGAFGSQTFWLRPTEKMQELFEKLKEYPLLDEGKCSEVESRWEYEDFTSWILAKLWNHLEDEIDGEAVTKEIKSLGHKNPEDFLYWCYHDAKEAENLEYVTEYNGGWIDVDKLKDAFLQALKKRLEDERDIQKDNTK